jgi:enoyl-CoA hydratase/carnithine racemase
MQRRKRPGQPNILLSGPTMPNHLHSAAEILLQLASPAASENFSPLGEQPFLLLDLQAATVSEIRQLQTHLPQLCCPVIAVGAIPEAARPLCDTTVNTAEEAEALCRNIRNSPIAAMTLVQLLRHNERASAGDGLLAESLAYSTLQGGAEFRRFIKQKKPLGNEHPIQPAVMCHRVDNWLTIQLNRPDRANAFSVAMRDGLVEALQLLAADTSITGATICGNGKHFSAGGDLDEFGTLPDAASAHAVRSMRSAGRLISENAERIECHVHGACIGAGIELPAFCHYIQAQADSFFRLPEVSFGLIPGAGGTVSVLRRIGKHRCAWLALSGQAIDARTALDWGLVDNIFDADEGLNSNL